MSNDLAAELAASFTRPRLNRILNGQQPTPTDPTEIATLMHVASTQQFVRLHGCVLDDHPNGAEIWEAARQVLAAKVGAA